MIQIDPQDPISKHFTWREALWLPSWKRLANESDGLCPSVITNLIDLFSKLDVIREYFGLPIIVHCAYRPVSYNSFIGGAKESAHMALGSWAACDFHVSMMPCDDARDRILRDGKLEELGLRMENPGYPANWVHVDSKPVSDGGSRFFIP